MTYSTVKISRPKITSVWHDRATDIPSALWNKCFSPSLEGYWWYHTLEESGLENQFRFKYLVVSDGDVPCAIAPVFSMDLPLRIMAPSELEKVFDWLGKFSWLKRLLSVRTMFVGSPCADEGTVGIAAGADRERIIRHVNETVSENSRRCGAEMVVWKDFNSQDSSLLSRELSEVGFVRVCSYPGTELTLPSGTFDDYLKSLKKSRRQNLKQKLSSGRKAGTITSEVMERPDTKSLEEMYALFAQTYERAHTKFENLDLKFFQLMAMQKPARFLVLRDVDNRIVAFRLFLVLQDKIIFKFIGLDYQANRQYFLLFRLIEEGIKFALANGISLIQSGQTGYAAKLETGSHLIPQYNFMKHSNPVIHFVLAFIAKSITWAGLDDDLATYLKAHPDALP